MSRRKRGLRIGRYRITPLGLGIIAAAVLLVLVLIAVLVIKSADGMNDNATPGVNKDAQVVVETPVPTVSVEPTATATPVPTPTPAPTPRSARIRSLGEITADHEILKSAYKTQVGADGETETSTFEFEAMFDMIGDTIGNADYTVAMVNGTMGGKGIDGYRGKKGEYNTPPHLMLALLENGVDMLALAHDHALDEFYDGLKSTIANCKEAGVDYIGAATTQEEADTPKIVTVNDIKIGFLNYSDDFNGKLKTAAKEASEFGVNYFETADCAADAAVLREAGAEVIVAYMSWGKEGSAKASNAQGSMAKKLVEAGVDVIIGYNPREVQAQPMFWLELEQEDGSKLRSLCVCSVGTLLSDSDKKGQDAGIIFEFTLTENADGEIEVEDPTYIPTYVWKTEGEDGLYDYKVLACGDWLAAAPEGMDEEDYERLKAVWSEIQEKLGATELSVKAN